MSTTTKLMVAAVAVAIVIGVVGGLLFGRMYAPDEEAPSVVPAAEAQADGEEDVQP